jgi:hypothetical protein
MRNPGSQEGLRMALEHKALAEPNIGAAIEVHRRLGTDSLELIYENALIIHFAIVRSPLKAVSRQHGLLLDFDKPTLEPK